MSERNKTLNETIIDLSNTIETQLSRTIRFWILLPCSILSLGCCILLLFYLLAVKKVREALNNHVVIVLIVLEFIYMMIDISLYLNYIRLAMVWPQIPTVCLVWWIASDGIHETITILVAWASFERHILVLHKQLVSTKRGRFLFHYIPIVIILLYGTIFYGWTIFFPPCKHTFRYSEEWCSEACLFENENFLLYQLVVNEILFTVLIGIFSVLLIIRILWQKRTRLNQPIQWRKHRKMTIQLLAISAPYLCFHLPEMIVAVTKPFDLKSDFGRRFEMYMNFVSFFAELALPFICFAALYPKPWRRQNRAIGDATMANNYSLRQLYV